MDGSAAAWAWCLQGRHGVLQPRVPAAAHHDRGVEGEVRARHAAADGAGVRPGGDATAQRRGLRRQTRHGRHGLLREAIDDPGMQLALARHAPHTSHAYIYLLLGVVSYVICSEHALLVLLCWFICADAFMPRIHDTYIQPF